MTEDEHPNAPAIRKAMEIKATAMRQLAEGHASLNRAQEDHLAEPIALTSPVGLEHAQTLCDLVRPVPNMRGAIIETAMTAVMRGRRRPAGIAFAELRQSFGGGDRDWVTFVKKDMARLCAERGLAPFAIEAIERLIGEVASMKALAICEKCSAMVLCPCGCGAPYIPQMPWMADEPEVPADDVPGAIPALERAKDALRADPNKSNRLIAQEIGVSEWTVREARKRLAPDLAPAPIPANDD